MSEEPLESPYCDVCGTCGYIDCCGIRNFIDEHIKGKTNCKNEDGIIADLINLCEYKDKVFEDNDNLKKEIERLKKDFINQNNTIIDLHIELNQRQSKINKAIEYIKNNTEERFYKEPYNIDGMPDRVEYFIKGKWDLLSILEGDKDE